MSTLTTGTAKTKRSIRLLRKRDPQLQELLKRTLCVRGPKASDTCIRALRDVHKMQWPNSVLLRKRNDIRPFEDATSIEFLCQRSDHSLFSLVSHSKKRPHNLMFGRCFNYQMLDLYEFGLSDNSFISMSDFDSVRSRSATVRVGGKPLLIFQGLEWEYNADFSSFRNFAIDFFRGEVLPKINLASIDRIIIFTIIETTIFFRQYGILFKKSGTKYPRVELEEIGPRMDLLFRRRKCASDDVRKAAMKFAPKEQIQLQKNIQLGQYGNKMGKIYLGRQDLNNLAIRRMKALKKRKRDDNEEGNSMQKVNGNSTSSNSSHSSSSSSSAAASASSHNRVSSHHQQQEGQEGVKRRRR